MLKALAVLLSLPTAFFLFYTVRLLVVTHFLTMTREGGQGTYIGAIAFPVLAIICGLLARAAWRRGSRPPAGG